MKHSDASAWLVALIVVCCAVDMSAANRVRAGLWETTVTVAGTTATDSACLTEPDAAAINGDVASIRAMTDKTNEMIHCKTTNVVINGNQVVVTSLCGGKENVSTTTYHGESLDTVNTIGVKVHSRWVGACK
jgi:hypothetical protein